MNPVVMCDRFSFLLVQSARKGNVEGEKYHLCWTKLVLNSGFTSGGSGCTNSEENSIMEEGNGEHRSEEAAVTVIEAARTVKSWWKRIVAFDEEL